MILMQTDAANLATAGLKNPSYPQAAVLSAFVFPTGSPVSPGTGHNPQGANQAKGTALREDINLPTLMTLTAQNTMLPAVQFTFVEGARKHQLLLSKVTVIRVHAFTTRTGKGTEDFVDFTLHFGAMTRGDGG